MNRKEKHIYLKKSTTAAFSPTSTRAVVSSVNISAADDNDPLAPLYRDTWFIGLLSTGVGVIVTGLICLSWFACKKRRKHNKMRLITSDQGIGMSSGPAETYSLITSVPTTSQPISVESHQGSKPDPTAAYSFTVYQHSEVLVNTQQKQGNSEEDEVTSEESHPKHTQPNETSRNRNKHIYLVCLFYLSVLFLKNVYHLYCTIPDKPVHSNAEDPVYSLVL
ncbi:uncharacterized protein [Pseudorasbora parva]|uniref:uncharacterized protein isoform X2 n=1 Tax=Pseudorasbora parva TaxID=51549 RepID=UPI00351EDDD0